jgi:site-specific DNA recombinase
MSRPPPPSEFTRRWRRVIAQVGLLIAQLQHPEGMLEAKEALRGLIDRIVLTPDAATGCLSLDLEGALARLLWVTVAAEGGIKRQKPAGAGYEVSEYIAELVLVAGVGFEPTTFRL